MLTFPKGLIIIDDPLDPANNQELIKAKREKMESWFNNTLRKRLLKNSQISEIIIWNKIYYKENKSFLEKK
jgi:hypothetical protein